MPILTGPEIARGVADGTITIEPYDPAQVNPNSYNLRFSEKIAIYDKMLPLHRHLEWKENRRARREAGEDVYKDAYSEHSFVPTPVPLDMAVEEPITFLTVPPEGMVMFPGVLYLGSTVEYTETPNHAPKIDGRSGIGRLGKTIHVTAGFGDVGFNGDWTLEIVVVYPLRVYPGVPICQICYTTVHGDRQKYQGKYQGQRGPKASGMWKEFRCPPSATPTPSKTDS